jgi:hypothetical protein
MSNAKKNCLILSLLYGPSQNSMPEKTNMFSLSLNSPPPPFKRLNWTKTKLWHHKFYLWCLMTWMNSKRWTGHPENFNPFPRRNVSSFFGINGILRWSLSLYLWLSLTLKNVIAKNPSRIGNSRPYTFASWPSLFLLNCRTLRWHVLY